MVIRSFFYLLFAAMLLVGCTAVTERVGMEETVTPGVSQHLDSEATVMIEQVGAEGAATRRYALTSNELVDVVAVRGTAKLLEEKADDESQGTAPSLYQRRFELTDIEVIRGAPVAESPSSFTFSGFTTLAPLQRTLDLRSPTLELEGQAFFDSSLPSEPMDVLLLIGGPEIVSTVELTVRGASVESGDYQGQPVRAFLIEGADATLPEALPLLVGWQAEQTLETARAAIMVPHPLIALDALRIASRSGASEQVELLGRWLLHPAEPAGVRVTAIKLLGEAINQMPAGSPEADALIAVAVGGWEVERGYPVDAAYLRSLQSAAGHIKASSQVERVRVIADDYQTRELTTLSDQLKKSLK